MLANFKYYIYIKYYWLNGKNILHSSIERIKIKKDKKSPKKNIWKMIKIIIHWDNQTDVEIYVNSNNSNKKNS